MEKSSVDVQTAQRQSKKAPRRPQDAPKALHDASQTTPRRPQRRPKTSPRRPKTSTRRLQDAPRHSKNAPRRHKTLPRLPERSERSERSVASVASKRASTACETSGEANVAKRHDLPRTSRFVSSSLLSHLLLPSAPSSTSLVLFYLPSFFNALPVPMPRQVRSPMPRMEPRKPWRIYFCRYKP